ncbi:MAG: hypothetical protein RIF41_03390 [Polyangiaceae bacterium]
MAASKASLASLPGSLPKAPRGLSFDSADRSSVRALSHASPLPIAPAGPPPGDDLDPEAEIETLLFHRDDPDLEELEALRRIAGANDTHRAPSVIPDPPPTPRFAPPLPIPPFEAIEHPTGTGRRAAVAPPPTDFTRPLTLRRPVVPTRRFPWGGVAVLAIAAAIGALAGWLATPYVHEAPPSAQP